MNSDGESVFDGIARSPANETIIMQENVEEGFFLNGLLEHECSRCIAGFSGITWRSHDKFMVDRVDMILDDSLCIFTN